MEIPSILSDGMTTIPKHTTAEHRGLLYQDDLTRSTFQSVFHTLDEWGEAGECVITDHWVHSIYELIHGLCNHWETSL